MIPRYILTLATTVFAVTLVAASMRFATSSHVLSGTGMNEVLRFEFTIDADSKHTYEINADTAQFLQTHIAIHSEGPPRVSAVEVEVTPKQVSWTENRQTITAPGAALTVQLRWDTPSDSANDSRGDIYMTFPEIPGLEGKPINMRSGPYQLDSGRYVIREVTTYRNTYLLSLGRCMFALSAGLPFGILLHTIAWAFVVKSDRRSRISQLASAGSGLPQMFYPDPAAEWTTWLIVLGVGTLIGGMMAALSVFSGFMSSTFVRVVYIVFGIVTAVAALLTYFTSKRLLTLRVGSEGISYARGRENLQWVSAAWNEVLSLMERSRTYRGRTTRWIEIQFQDNRKKLKVPQSTVGYGDLVNLVARMKPQ